MTILDIFRSFKTQEQAVEYLERVRWHGHPTCPYCGEETVCRHASGDRAFQRWQCWSCTRAFSVTVGTIFHGTHVPLRDWFLLLALMLNAKKSLSAYQISRDTGLRRATVWSMMHRVRMAMVEDPEQKKLLYGIVEIDEAYIGGKPRKTNDKKPTGKRGHGTDKAPVVGVAERGGRVIARPADKKQLNRKGIVKFVQEFVDTAGTLLISDTAGGYGRISEVINHAQVNHQVCYVDGMVHTNTIEGFWSLVKRAWYGSHHHYSRKYLPLYLAEACYKYNRRKERCSFDATLKIMAAAA